MINLENIPLTLAHKENYNNRRRRDGEIEFIVMHYTANIGDTAVNNVRYFHDTVTKSSAHYFVCESDIQQSVPDKNVAYSVGLGSMKRPYTSNPLYWTICTNSNSISIEMCGSKTSREASFKTKQTACELAVALLRKYHLRPESVIRHYDVTGKKCPAWAVDDVRKWEEIKQEIERLYIMCGDDEMTYSEANYAVFKQFMDRYFNELGEQPITWEADAMDWVKQKGLINDGKPKAYVTRGQLATILQRYDKK